LIHFYKRCILKINNDGCWIDIKLDV